MTCDEVREQLEAYTLGALAPEEMAAIEQHLTGCADCQRLYNEYTGLVSGLPLALARVSPHKPPAALKDRLLEAIDAVETPSPLKHAQSRIQPLLQLWRWSSAAALILLLFALVYITRLNSVLAQEQVLRENLTHQTELIFEVVDSETTTRLFLRPSQNAPVIPGLAPPYGKVFTRTELPYVVAMTGRLAPPPEGKVYYLWLFNDGQAELAGEVSVDEKGFGSLVYEANREGPVYETAQLHLQNRGDSQPSGTLILAYAP